MNLKELFSKYLELYAKPRKKTWRRDQLNFDCMFGPIAEISINHLTRLEVEQFQLHVKNKHGLYSSNRAMALLRTVLNKAVDWELLTRNVASKVKLFPEKSRSRILDEGELPRFISALKQEHNLTIRDFFYILLMTGARKGNVLAMRWEDLTLSGESPCWKITDTKNGEEHIVPLIYPVVVILRDRGQAVSGPWVFPCPYDSSQHLSDPRRGWERLKRKAGLTNIRMHDLRRTLASLLVKQGANSFIIGKTLGHKSQQATAIYAQVTKQVARSALESATAGITL